MSDPVAGTHHLVVEATSCEELRRAPASRVLRGAGLPASCPYGQQVCPRSIHYGAVNLRAFCATNQNADAEICKPGIGPVKRAAALYAVRDGIVRAQTRTTRAQENNWVRQAARMNYRRRAESQRLAAMAGNADTAGAPDAIKS